MRGRLRTAVAAGIIACGNLACSDAAHRCAETRTCPSVHHSGGQGGSDGGERSGVGGTGAASGGSAGELIGPSMGGAGDSVDAGDSRTRDCPPGFADCNESMKDGCEVELSKNVQHCGECDTECAATGTTEQSCVRGSCKPTCDDTHADCNGLGVDGCEASLDTDAKNCGACDHACTTDGATAVCKDRECKFTCLTGRADCNDDPADGCEVDLMRDPSSCGSCGRVCATTHATSIACGGGVCRPFCADGYGDCNSPAEASPDDGCETNVTQPANCGACGHNCQGGTCTNATCDPVTLASGLPIPGPLAADDNYVHFMVGPEHLAQYSLQRITITGTDRRTLGSYASAEPVADGTDVFFSAPGTDPKTRKFVRVASGTQAFQEAVLGEVGPVASDGKVFYFGRATTTQGAVDGRMYQLTRDLATSTAVSATVGPFLQIATDGKTLFGLAMSAIVAQPLPTGSPRQAITTTASHSNYRPRLALDATHVYMWETGTTAGVVQLTQRSKALEGTPTVLATSQSRFSFPLATDADWVYFGQDDGVYRVRNTGGAPVKLAPAIGVPALVVWKGVVYWTEGGKDVDSGSLRKLAVFPN